MTPELVAACAGLRLSDLQRSPGYQGSPAALEQHLAFMKRAVQGGSLQCLQEGGEVIAVVVSWSGHQVGEVMPTTFFGVHRLPRPGTLRWLREVLPKAWPADAQVQLAAWDAELRALLLGSGLAISSVAMAGPLATASERVARRPVRPAPPGVRLRPFEDADVDGVISLYQEVFGAEPAFCPFGTQPVYLDQVRRKHLDPEADGTHFVFEREGVVRGMIGAWFREPDIHTPPSSAGIDLLLGRELRGQGLSWMGYRWVIAAAWARGARWIKGTTGQPSVMHMARALGRWTTALNLRVDAPFSEEWFAQALTAAAIGVDAAG